MTATSFGSPPWQQPIGHKKKTINQLIPIHVNTLASPKFNTTLDMLGVDQGIDTMDPFPEMVSPSANSLKKNTKK